MTPLEAGPDLNARGENNPTTLSVKPYNFADDRFLVVFVCVVEEMMLLPRRPPLLLSPSLTCTVFVRHSVTSALRAAVRRGEIAPGKRGPAKGKLRDPNDPTKTINRTEVINFRPRGPNKMPTTERSITPRLAYLAESDKMGKMVHETVTLDITGIPEKIPDMRYKRVPMLKTEEGSYFDWKHRRFQPSKLLLAINRDIQKLEFEVGRLAWERGLRERPPLSEDAFDGNRRILEILKGIFLGETDVELRDRALEAGSRYKAKGLDSAIRSVESYHSIIKSGEEMMAYPGIGPATAEKIQEIIDTVRLFRRLWRGLWNG
jgi:hypothetical protein